MEICIQNLEDEAVPGVRYCHIEACMPWNERYFSWMAMPLVSAFATNGIACGLLTGWRHTPEFSVVETHADKELFYFFNGTALLFVCDTENGAIAPGSARILRVPAGTELEIDAGKAHFVAVAEDERYDALVISPVQDAPRQTLLETVSGR